jgi:hypothetical protein
MNNIRAQKITCNDLIVQGTITSFNADTSTVVTEIEMLKEQVHLLTRSIMDIKMRQQYTLDYNASALNVSLFCIPKEIRTLIFNHIDLSHRDIMACRCCSKLWEQSIHSRRLDLID